MHDHTLRPPVARRAAPGAAVLTVGALVVGLFTGPAAVAAPEGPAPTPTTVGSTPATAPTGTPSPGPATPEDAPGPAAPEASPGPAAPEAAPVGTPQAEAPAPTTEPAAPEEIPRPAWNPGLTGRAVVDQSLAVHVPTVEEGTGITYRWYRGTTAISGAAGPGYRPTPADVGHPVHAELTLTRAGAQPLVLSSDAVTVQRALFTAAPAPALAGTAKVGHSLTANPGTWSPAGATFSYQWYRGSTAIRGATARTYALGAADNGASVKVRVRATKAGYTTAERWSTARKVAAGSISATRPLKITGTARFGQTLRISQGWTPGSTLSYQWYRNGRPVKGATRSTLSLGAADVGTKISVKVTARKAGYTTRSTTSGPVSVGKAYITTRSAPTISGTKKSGHTLTAGTGSYSPTPSSYGYQWYRSGKAIPGATHRTYRLGSADNGKKITVTVWARKAHHHTRAATSAAVSIPAPPRTVISADGTYRVGTQLKPGLYRATGTGDSCYWERKAGFSGGLDDINANHWGSARTYVQILPGDRGFETSGCGRWTTVPSTGAQATRITADGTYRVGVDIRPGLYRAYGSGSSCYWETKSGFTGELDDILDNYLGSARTYVEIPADAKGFEVDGCGTLVRQ